MKNALTALNRRHPSTRTMQAALAACCLFIPVIFSAPVHAQQDDTFNRINRLEREIETLNRAVYKGEKPATPSTLSGSSSGDPSYQANTEVRLSEIEKQMRDLTGKIEQQGFENQQLRERLDRSLADMELRMGDIEKRNGMPGVAPQAGASLTTPVDPALSGSLNVDEMSPSAAPISPTAGMPPEPAPILMTNNNATQPITNPNAPAPANSPTQGQLGVIREAPGGAVIPPNANDPAAVYENAFSQLKGGNFAVAQRDFDGFLKTYPQHPLASNATYWLGETYYAQGKYDQASRIFAESYKKYPKGPKAADSLLKLGMSLGGSGKNKEACVSLKQLKKEYAAVQGTAVRRADQEMSRLGCTV